MRSLKSVFFHGLRVLLLLQFFQPMSPASILPQGLPREDAFTPGYGESIGTVLMVQGIVYVVHAGMEPAYRMRDNAAVFKGDTIYTEDKGLIRLQLNDGSTIALASQTQLTLTKSVYNPSSKTRSSFLKMTLGRARFYVVKLLQFKQAAFKVKTNTFVAGVRGSDFVITAMVDSAAVAALDDTTLEIQSLAAPDAEPMLLTDFQKTSVDLGGLPSEPEEIPRSEIEALKEAFSLTQEPPAGAPSGSSEKEKSGPEAGRREGGGTMTETPRADKGIEAALTGLPSDRILLAPDEMAVPLRTDSLLMNGEQPASEFERRELNIDVQETQSEIKTIITDIREDDTGKIPELPPLPGRPQ